MKKIFLIVFTIFSQLGAESLQPIQPMPNNSTDVPIYLSSAELLERAKKSERSRRPIFHIQHGKHPNWLAFAGSVYNFYDKRIFFDRDKSKNPIYKKISEHATDNPNFGKVLLVLYHHKKKHKKQFTILGTYSDEVARKKFLRKMKTLFGYACARAIWCPEQNAFILCEIDIVNDGWGHSIDRAFDPEIGKKFEQWLTSKK